MSSKINRLAVIIAGDFRKWNVASRYIFDFANRYADKVDYYFATWSTTRDYWWPEEKSVGTVRPVTGENLIEPFRFSGNNLIDFKIVDQSVLPRYHITIYYQSYLANVANFLKRRYEFHNNFVYDQVIEVRPDLHIMLRDDYQELSMCGDFEYTAGLEYKQDCSPYHQVNDFYSRSSSFANDVISKRFYNQQPIDLVKYGLGMWDYCTSPQNNHWVLLDYLYARRLISITQKNDNWKEVDSQFPIRPNYPEDIDQLSLNEIVELQRKWIASQWK